jgi:undecaprenyl diphosphate synthase
MDGNGRWAQSRGLPRLAGHREGARSVRRIVEAAPRMGISTLTLYAFSSDNWSRPAEEVRGLMTLFRKHLRQERERMVRRGVRLSVIGRRDRLDGDLLRRIEEVERITSAGRSLHLRLAVDYSARWAIAEAARGYRGDAELSLDEFYDRINRAMHCREAAPDADLVIRTSGEKRLSDFLLWESAYAELVFTPQAWPDFGERELAAALGEFRRRERRFGALATVV